MYIYIYMCVCVCVCVCKLKKALFNNIRNLKDRPQWQEVRIANDLTPAEREKEKSLRDQAKNLEREGKGKHAVRGPPWRRRLVKIQE